MYSSKETTLERSVVDPVALRTGLSAVPTPIVIVSGRPVETSTPAAIVIGSFVSVSLDPPLVGFFIGNSSTTWPTLRLAERITVSVLGVGHEELCMLVSKRSSNMFAGHLWETDEAGTFSVRGAVLVLNGSVESETPAGDHSFVLVRVHELTAGDTTPLVFHDRALRALSS